MGRARKTCIDVYAAILSHWQAHGTAPTVRQLTAACGYASNNAVQGHIAELRLRGLLVMGEPTLLPAAMVEPIKQAATNIIESRGRG